MDLKYNTWDIVAVDHPEYGENICHINRVGINEQYPYRISIGTKFSIWIEEKYIVSKIGEVPLENRF